MKSEWEVCEQMVGHARWFSVYRLRNKDKGTGEENREYYKHFAEDQDAAYQTVKELNEKEAGE